MIALLLAMLIFWAGTALVWWQVESYWGRQRLSMAFRLFRAVTWLPAFLYLPIPWGDRLHLWLLRSTTLEEEE